MILAHDQHITLSEWLVASGLAIGAAVAGIVLALAITKMWPLYPKDK